MEDGWMSEHAVESSEKIVVDLSKNKPIRILLVDDEPDLLKVAKGFLEMEGQFLVDTASSAEEAVEKMKEETFEAVVSDYQMPGKDGLEFLKELRRRGDAVPFIMFTGKGREEVAIDALNLGADQYLNKTGNPVTVYGELAHAIRLAADRKKAQEKMAESEEKYRKLFETAPDSIVTLNLKGVITSCNAALVKHTGFSKDEIVGRHFSQLGFLHPGNTPKFLASFAAIVRGKVPGLMQVSWHRKDGTVCFSELHFSLIRENNKVVGIQAVAIDITERKKAEFELQESERRFRELADQLPVVVYEIDSRGRFTFVNEKGFELTGYSRKDGKKGLNILQVVTSGDQDTAKARIQRLLNGENVGYNEYAVTRKDGSTFPAVVCSSAIVRGGKIVGLRGIVVDVTERKKSERELFEKQIRLQNVFAASPYAIVIADMNGIIVDCNEQAQRMFGFSTKDEAIGRRGLDFIAKRDRQRALEDMAKTLKQSLVKKVEYVVVTRKGQERLAQVSVSVIKDVSGNPMGFATVMEDITERKRAEEALRESEEKYADLFENARDAIYTHDLKGKITSVNRVVEEYGYRRNEIIGRNILKFVPKKYWPRLIAQLAQMAQGNPVEGEIEVITPVGKRSAEYRSNPMRAGGKVVGVQSILRDVTERKKAEETLRESEEKFRNLAEQSPNMIFINERGRVVYANKKAEEMVGYTKEEFYSSDFDFLNLIAPEWRELIKSNFAKHMKAQKVAPIEYSLLTKQGGTIDALLTTKLIVFQGKPAILGTVTDISSQKRAERAILESQQRFEGLFMGNPEAAAYLGPDFHILNVNPRFEELFGHSLAEIRGKHIDDVVVQGDKMDEARMLNERAMKGYVYHNTVRRRKDGFSVSVSVSAAPITVEGGFAGVVAMYKDISELKKAERKLEMMNEKLQVVGGLTRHDVRNKLSTIMGHIFLNKKRLADRPEALESFRDMELACEQIVRIFDFARDYEMLGVEELKYVDVEKIVDEAVSFFPDLHGVKITNGCRGLTVLADSLLGQLFCNLIDNSLKYGGKMGQIRIHYEGAGGNQLRLMYEDDGVGIPSDSKPKLFREGYTTGKGSGYGLYLVKRMMEVYGWSIRETGTPGKGVHFTITISETNQDGKANYRFH